MSFRKYIVGGYVRDLLLGLEPKDKDWVVVGAHADELKQLGYTQVGKDFPVFLHPKTKQEHALARTERKISKGHKGFAVDFAPNVTLLEDLQRRDFTINAIAIDDAGNIIDLVGGCTDLDSRTIRHITDEFSADPLRVLRLARFYAKLNPLGFDVAEKTLDFVNYMVENGELAALSKDRIWQESIKALQTSNPQLYFGFLKNIGALFYTHPLLDKLSSEDFRKLECRLKVAGTKDADVPVKVSLLYYKIDKNKLFNLFNISSKQQKICLGIDLFYSQCHKIIDRDYLDILFLLQKLNSETNQEVFNTVLDAAEILYYIDNPDNVFWFKILWIQASQSLQSLKVDVTNLHNVNTIKLEVKRQKITALKKGLTWATTTKKFNLKPNYYGNHGKEFSEYLKHFLNKFRLTYKASSQVVCSYDINLQFSQLVGSAVVLTYNENHLVLLVSELDCLLVEYEQIVQYFKNNAKILGYKLLVAHVSHEFSKSSLLKELNGTSAELRLYEVL